MMTRIFIAFLFVIFCATEISAQKDSIADSKYYPAKGKAQNLVLMLLGGSEGGLPNYYEVEKLTSLG